MVGGGLTGLSCALALLRVDPTLKVQVSGEGGCRPRVTVGAASSHNRCGCETDSVHGPDILVDGAS